MLYLYLANGNNTYAIVVSNCQAPHIHLPLIQVEEKSHGKEDDATETRTIVVERRRNVIEIGERRIKSEKIGTYPLTAIRMGIVVDRLLSDIEIEEEEEEESMIHDSPTKLVDMQQPLREEKRYWEV
ncbi:hypothetical protein L6452_39084 [Arctium lappa]|uniref:Uncharacterized protein n=1 Tax=Arctium lappa TaxID=4217 RepID=A0ACB8XSH2_ARCLA|nr:hypothetical protein L6452_39084 [Arctium lappa]